MVTADAARPGRPPPVGKTLALGSTRFRVVLGGELSPAPRVAGRLRRGRARYEAKEALRDECIRYGPGSLTATRDIR